MSQSNPRAVVIGGGTMGGGIAVSFAAGGYAVDIVSPSEKTRAGLPARMRDALARMGSASDLSKVETHASFATVPWPDVDIVVESASEDLALKQQLFKQLESLAPAQIPLTSNSSSFPISDIGRGLRTQSRMMGLHYFMPAHLIPLVEIVRSVHTSVDLAEQVGEMMRKLKKRPVQVKKDIIGFIANRIQLALMREALYLIDQGIASPADVDATVRYSFGFRYAAAGPIMQKEFSGWDISCAVYKIVFPTLCNDSVPAQVLQNNVAEGRLGFKTKQGFFKWDDRSMAKERARYERALLRCMEIFKEEGIS